MTDPMTDADLDAIKQRAHQWASPLSIKCPACGSRPGDLCYGNGPMRRPHEQRREAVRQRVIDDVPALLAEVRRLRAMEQRVSVTCGGQRATTTRKETTMMSKTDPTKGRMLSTQDVAARLGVKPATVSGYRHHGYMPKPDGKLGNTVWWWEATIDKWQAARPGRGWKKGLTGGA